MAKKTRNVNYQMNLQLAESLIFNRGFKAGTKEQRETDIQQLINVLESLEEIPGVGEVTANKIREMFMSQFGKDGS
jgi:DNA uptake protein ComE-like DNA-binding protein